jgi:Mn2+/Fe2+ NRAMP family transporter
LSLVKIIKNLGPGLLYAAAAVGVSHLVQSTRAGAEFGLQMIAVVILANILKYPFFKMGPMYANVTGKNILHGYRKLGTWAIVVFLLTTFSTMFIIQSAVTVVTAGIIKYLFNIEASLTIVSAVLLAICSLILIIGKYTALDKIVKIIIALLTISTIVAVSTSSQAPAAVNYSNPFDFTNTAHVLFLIALMGWMPAPLDISIWHSIWTEESLEDHVTSKRSDNLDFNIGYIGTAILALFFILLGRNVMYGSAGSFSPSAVTFASQLINLYTEGFGPWALYVMGTAALMTMFSTTLTLLDAFPRSINAGGKLLRDTKLFNYNIWLAITSLGTLVIIGVFLKNMRTLVDLATSIAFLTAPLIAILNFLVIKKEGIKLSKLDLFLVALGFIYLQGFCLFYLKLKLF